MVKIYWKSKMTEAKGNGTVDFSIKDAEEIVDDLNKKYPYITHWAE